MTTAGRGGLSKGRPSQGIQGMDAGAAQAVMVIAELAGESVIMSHAKDGLSAPV